MSLPTPTPTLTTNGTPQSLQAAPRDDDVRKKWFEDMRGWIMVVAVLVASVTYTTGLNPPGGFWQDDNGHNAGSAILRDKMPDRYTTFFYANATAFMASLIIIILLMNENFYTKPVKVAMLNICMVLDLVSMMIAYAAGCARHLSTSIYVIVVAVGILFFVLFSCQILQPMYNFAVKCAPWLGKLAGRDFILNKRDLVQESA